MSTSSAAVREHLARIVEDERDRTLRWTGRVRVAAASLYTLQTVWYVVGLPLPEARAALPVLVLYSVLGGALALFTELVPRVRRASGFAPALLDIPFITLAAFVAVPFVPDPHPLLHSTLPFVTAVIVGTTLTLDYRMIAASTLSAALGTVGLMLHMGEDRSAMEDPLMALVLSGVFSALAVSRLRALVQESRRKDFAGRYLLGKRLGVGGMAEVFTAVYAPEGSFQRQVAVKRVLPAFARDEEFLALFRREAELGALLAHPNLVQVLDFGRHMDSWFIAMELVQGISLAGLQRSRAGEPLPVEVGLFVVAEVAEGLCYLHEKRSVDGQQVGLVHRDVNAPNVLISLAGEVKLGDFGIARWASSSFTRAGIMRGKVSSMAPEVLKGAEPSAAADVFSLGVLAFEVLTGMPLFRGRSDAELFQAVLEQPLVRPSTARLDLEPEVDALVMSLLERDPALRPTARAVSGRLRALQGAAAPYPLGRAGLISALSGLELHPTGWEPSPAADTDPEA